MHGCAFLCEYIYLEIRNENESIDKTIVFSLL